MEPLRLEVDRRLLRLAWYGRRLALMAVAALAGAWFAGVYWAGSVALVIGGGYIGGALATGVLCRSIRPLSSIVEAVLENQDS